MSDSHKGFDLLMDIKPYSFEPLANKVTDSINCEELTVVSADVHLEQPMVPPTNGPGPQLNLFGKDDITFRSFLKILG